MFLIAKMPATLKRYLKYKSKKRKAKYWKKRSKYFKRRRRLYGIRGLAKTASRAAHIYNSWDWYPNNAAFRDKYNLHKRTSMNPAWFGINPYDKNYFVRYQAMKQYAHTPEQQKKLVNQAWRTMDGYNKYEEARFAADQNYYAKDRNSAILKKATDLAEAGISAVQAIANFF